MKSIFPKAEETVILDVLANNDNNIQKTSDILKEMGYEKRDVFKLLQQQAEEKAKAEEEELIQIQAEIDNHIPQILSPDDKAKSNPSHVCSHEQIDNFLHLFCFFQLRPAYKIHTRTYRKK